MNKHLTASRTAEEGRGRGVAGGGGEKRGLGEAGVGRSGRGEEREGEGRRGKEDVEEISQFSALECD